MAALGAEGLVERELELSHLRRALDHSWHGVGRLVVIHGPAGIGKTSLLQIAREVARREGMSVCSARGAELEQGFAFGIVRQLLEPLILTATDVQRAEWLVGAAALAAPLFDPHAPVENSRGDASIYPRLHGLYWMCSNIARVRPLALCVDDAHWADDPSQAFLAFLARRLEELPILLVVAVRSIDADVPDALSSLLSEPAIRVLEPRGLSAQGIERMLTQDGSDGVEERFVVACREASAGNPFLVRELLHELDERGIEPVAANAEAVSMLAPKRVGEAVLGRLRRLSPAAPVLARAVAILGDGASLADAAALSGLDERTVIETAGAMRREDLLADEAGLTFAHPIIRATIYDSVLPAERVMRHAQAATLLHDRAASAEQVAAQILLADAAELSEAWVMDELRLAASSALAIGAPRSAVAYLRRALDADQDPDDRAHLLAQLGRAEARAGFSSAPDHLQDAVRLTTDPRTRARVAIELAELLKFTGSAPRGVEVLAAIDPVDDSQLGDRVETEMLSAALSSGGAHELLAERIAVLEDHGGPARTDSERFQLVLLAFEKLLDNRPVDEIVDLIARAELDLSGIGIVRPRQAWSAADVLACCERFDDAAAIASRLIDRARLRGSVGALVVGLSQRAEVAYRRGELAEALADATEAFELSKVIAATTPHLLQRPIATTNNVAVEQDHSAEELTDLLRVTDDNLDPDALHSAQALMSRARLLLATGHAQAALDQLLALERLPRTFGVGTPACIPWRSHAALIMHQLGDQPSAVRLAQDEVGLAQAMGAPRAVGISLRVLGLVRTPLALDVLEESARILEHSPARLEHARALVDLGAAKRRAGERAAARTLLRDGHDLAVRCSATLLAERARTEIVATGERIASRGLRGVASLTPSERRVAELAAQGQTNRDIAQALFVTEKTVETHLGHIYDKLDVHSRHKLGAVLERDAVAAA